MICGPLFVLSIERFLKMQLKESTEKDSWIYVYQKWSLFPIPAPHKSQIFMVQKEI